MANYKCDQNCFVFVVIHLISCFLLTFVYCVFSIHISYLSSAVHTLLFSVSCSPLLFLCSLSFLHTHVQTYVHTNVYVYVFVCVWVQVHMCMCRLLDNLRYHASDIGNFLNYSLSPNLEPLK